MSDERVIALLDKLETLQDDGNEGVPWDQDEWELLIEGLRLLALRKQQSADAKDAESWRNYIKAHQLTKEGLNGIHTNAALAKEQNAATHFTEEDAQFCGAVEEYKVKP